MPNKSPYVPYGGALEIAVEILLHRGAAEMKKIETESSTARLCGGAQAGSSGVCARVKVWPISSIV